MSRVHCNSCGTAVVVDPSGLCPDGHHVGAAGARVAQAMGSGSPHADEPEPWVAQVVLDDDPTPVTAVPRRARPVAVPGVATIDDADQESLLQELHALAELDLGGFGGESSTPAPTAPAAVTPPAPVAPVTSAPPPTPAAPIDPARGDELAALEAALHELSLPDEPAPARATDAAPATRMSGDDRPELLEGLAGLAELDELFASPRTAPATNTGSPTAAPTSRPATPQQQPAAPHAQLDERHDPPAAPARRHPEPSPPADRVPPPNQPPPVSPPDAPPVAETVPVPAPANLDIANFTAKGGKVGGRKRRFGR